MSKNYLIIALRIIRKNKIFSFINILGLSIGISTSLVIYLLVNYHFSFDQFEKDRGRIYRVVTDFNFSGEIYHNPGVMVPMGNAVRKEISGVEEAVPIYIWYRDTKVSVPVVDKPEPAVFKNQGNILFCDSAYFNMIGYQCIAGNVNHSLKLPYHIILTTSKAKLYFPGLKPEQLIGKMLYFNDTIRMTITGIVKDLTRNTDFTFTTFVSRATLEKTNLKPKDWDAWDNTNSASQLYLKLYSNTTRAQIESRIESLYKKYKPEREDHSITNHSLQPLGDIHFNENYSAYDLPVAHKPTLYGLLAIAVFLLLLGCINFINLTTANAAKRAKEIGIRKTMGGSRKQLIFQFLIETFILTFAATLLSVGLIPVILKAFSGFIPEGLHFNLIQQPEIFLFLILLLIAVSLLAGFYPALILSGYKPMLVLKNQAYCNTGKTRNAWLRKSLTVSQFVIAQVFIMCTILVSKQIIFALNKNLGFKKDAILYFNTNYNDTSNNKYLLMDKLRAIPGIAMVSLCSNPPSSSETWSGMIKYKDGKKEIESDVQQKFGDTNYVRLYGLKLLAGTNLQSSDTTNAYLINETYAHILGFHRAQDAVGKYVEWSDKKILIQGVIADFNQGSLHEPVKPLVIGTWKNTEHNISVALRSQNEATPTWKTSIAKIEKAWKGIYPKDDFEYQFFDEEIAKYYTAEQHISSLLKWATGLAVFISCLGLLGLVIYSTTQRTKEIGVRKVLGATVRQIAGIIIKEFILLIMIAYFIAAPLAWIGMHKWLEDFAYRTEISWWIFLLGGTIMIVIALCTLGFQTIRAAMANPVKSLRTE